MKLSSDRRISRFLLVLQQPTITCRVQKIGAITESVGPRDVNGVTLDY